MLAPLFCAESYMDVVGVVHLREFNLVTIPNHQGGSVMERHVLILWRL